MNKEQLLAQRMKLFDDAVRLRTPERIPTASCVFSWRVLDSDTHAKMSEAICDLDLMEKITREHIERYNFDAYYDFGLRNNGNLYKCFEGKSQYVINDETGGVNTPDVPIMEQDEYDEFMKDPFRFRWTKGCPRKVGEITFGQVQDAIQAQFEFGAYFEKIREIAVKEYGAALIIQPTAWCIHPLESFNNLYRGIKNFSLDLRRVPDKLEAVVEQLEPIWLASVKEWLERPNDRYAFNMYTAWLMHSILNRKQFERFFWPTMSKIYNMVAEMDATTVIFVEAEVLRFADYLNDIPKGHLAVHLETDDIFEARKAMPNMCLVGGMPTSLLGGGTKEECLAMANKLCTELGNEKYVFSQDKMVSFAGDATRENMLAVQEFVLNYR